jgi:hypothetical protein
MVTLGRVHARVSSSLEKNHRNDHYIGGTSLRFAKPGQPARFRLRRLEGRVVATYGTRVDETISNASEIDHVRGDKTRPLKVLVAGGGIGGLAIGLACRRQGMGESLNTFHQNHTTQCCPGG